MNKEEIDKQLDMTEDDTITINLLYQKVELLETILDKVTDKLKEDIKIYGNHEERKQMCKEQLYDNDAKWFHSREILNIIEGEKKR